MPKLVSTSVSERAGAPFAESASQAAKYRFVLRAPAPDRPLHRTGGCPPPRRRCGPGPRATIEALLLASLPTDEEGRTFHLLYSSYSILSVTDEALAAQPFIDKLEAAENALTGLLEQAQASGLADPGAAARTEAISLLAMTATMGTSILVGQRSRESALAVLRHHLDRIFRTAEVSVHSAGRS